MTLLRQLADKTLEDHPLRAAIVLERLGEADAIAVLEHASAARAAAIVPCLSPTYAKAVLELIEVERVVPILDDLGVDTVARLLRRLGEERQRVLLDRLKPKLSQAVSTLLRFPENSAGALMDPDVLALPMELDAREALARVREAAENARYNLYVLSQSKLVGAINLRELLLADSDTPLSDLMVRDPYRIPASADRTTVLAHPGWRKVHSLPVVDETDAYLGAIRYHALRSIEDDLRAASAGETDTGAAIGEVIAAGARGVLDALVGAAPGRGRGAF